MVLVGRPGYRIDNRSIKRGSRVSNLIASLWRAQTFAYLAYHLCSLLFGFYPCEDLELVFISMTSSCSSKNGFRMNILLHFLCWRFYRFVFYRKVKPFFLRFHPPLLDYDVSMHDLIELVMIFETSSSSSNSDSRWVSYVWLHFGGFTGSSLWEVPHLSPLGILSLSGT